MVTVMSTSVCLLLKELEEVICQAVAHRGVSLKGDRGPCSPDVIGQPTSGFLETSLPSTT